MTVPPHLVPPSRTAMRGQRYAGTPGEVIERLRAEGHSTDWYQPATPSVEAPHAETCGYFTIYYLEAQTAYTINHDGSKYLDYRTLKKTVDNSCWYCSGCKTRFPTATEALAHRDEVVKSEGKQ
jgi:hypothetical protein